MLMNVRGSVLAIALVAFGCAPTSREAPKPDEAAAKHGTPNMRSEWPFEDPQNLAVVTIKRIVNDGQPILYASHDEDDRGWQFLDGGIFTVEDAMLVSLQHVVQIDPTVKDLANLPLGWYAERAAAGQPWKRAKSD